MRDRVLIAVAHGSKDPRASATVAALAAVARKRSPGLDLRTAFLGHAPPSLPQVLGTIEADRPVTVLPLLLTAAFHSKSDIPRMLAMYEAGKLKLDELITRTYSLEQINEGYQDMRDGKNIRGVLVM